MLTKIGVFGRKEGVEHLKQYTYGDKNIEIIPFVYTKTEEIRELVEHTYMCDIYLFIGSLPYLYAKDLIDKKRLPNICVAFDEYMILTSFYRMKYDFGQHLNRFSTDITRPEYVSAVLRELNIKNRDIYTYSYAREGAVHINNITAHHKKLWDQGKIDYVLTSITEVQENLSHKDIPAYLMEIPERNILEAIEQARSTMQFNQRISAQIVAGFVQIKDFQSLEAHSKKEAVHQLHQLLSQFAKRTHATVLPYKENKFVLFGTRGTLDHITNHYRDLPLLKEAESLLHVSVEIGFGLGMTTKQAEDHAKSALKACLTSEKSSCYIVNDRKDLIGPIGVPRHVDTSKLYHALIHKARLNNELSYNFLDFIKHRNNEPFSSADIASYYRVTKRSAERTIHKLKTSSVIKEVGHEKPYVQGRPRKLFTINL